MVHENFELVVGFCGNALEVDILFGKEKLSETEGGARIGR